VFNYQLAIPGTSVCLGIWSKICQIFSKIWRQPRRYAIRSMPVGGEI